MKKKAKKSKQAFARIKGFISTIKKNGRNVMDELKNVFRGEAFVPVLG